MITKVEETESSEEFSKFIDDSFVSMCRSRDKTKHRVEYDDEKQELIFHYTDGTADRVQITQINDYKTTEVYTKVGENTVIKTNKN